ncbi:hypothetical protein A2U01_0031458, partial [Trifolium medium]|nr:hypothetical protein [Trifolium medium]
MEELCSPLWKSIQQGRVRFELIKVGFIHLVGLFGSKQTCHDGIVHVL